MNMTRKLARVERIEELTPIEGADAIELARVGGWRVVVQKNLHTVGDLAVYFEVDSLLPECPLFEKAAGRDGIKASLDEETGEKVYGYRLKCIRLKGQYSQGLLIPQTDMAELLGSDFDYETAYVQGTDLTGVLGVKKYEKYAALNANGKARGSFPSYIKKTDCTRCQNLKDEIWQAYNDNAQFQVSVKADGSSCTVWRVGGECGVASRNLSLKLDSSSNFTHVANKIHDSLKDVVDGDYCIQGELLAPNIQGNFEGVTKPEFYAFAMQDINEGTYLNPLHVYELCDRYAINHVPVLHHSVTLRELYPDVSTANELIDAIVASADGDSGFNGKFREGLVFKGTTTDLTFKAIGERYLMKKKD